MTELKFLWRDQYTICEYKKIEKIQIVWIKIRNFPKNSDQNILTKSREMGWVRYDQKKLRQNLNKVYLSRIFNDDIDELLAAAKSVLIHKNELTELRFIPKWI